LKKDGGGSLLGGTGSAKALVRIAWERLDPALEASVKTVL
jgi:hypothetical protein